MSNSKHLSVLMISGDASALDSESALSRRLSNYSHLCSRLSVLIFSRTAIGERKEDTLSVQGVPFASPLLGLYRAITLGEKMGKPDIVTTQDPFFLGLLGLCISRHHRVPLQIQIHTDLFSREFLRFSVGNRIRSFIARAIIPHAGGVRVVSKKIREDLIKRKIVEASRITVTPIPLAVISSLPQNYSKKSGFRMVTVSRLTPEKDISLALRAFALVHTQRPDATFTIVGDGPLRQNLEDEAKRLGVSDSVSFMGNQAVVAPFYRDATVYISTSHYEGYGLSLVEAASFGLPIVSTDAGIARELSPNTIVPWDAQKIADKLLSELPSPRIPESCGEGVEEYAHHIVEDWEKVSRTPMTEKKGTKFWFIIKYIISGGTATAVNLSFLYIFTDVLHIWYVFSAALAYAVAFVVSFTLQKFWTFKNGTLTRIKSQFVLYVVLGTFNMVLNSSLIYLIVESTGVHYLVAQIGIGVLIALWSLIFYRILFKNQ